MPDTTAARTESLRAKCGSQPIMCVNSGLSLSDEIGAAAERESFLFENVLEVLGRLFGVLEGIFAQVLHRVGYLLAQLAN